MCVYKIWQMSPETTVFHSLFHYFLYLIDFSENYTALEKKPNHFNDKTFDLV